MLKFIHKWCLVLYHKTKKYLIVNFSKLALKVYKINWDYYLVKINY